MKNNFNENKSNKLIKLKYKIYYIVMKHISKQLHHMHIL